LEVGGLWERVRWGIQGQDWLAKGERTRPGSAETLKKPDRALGPGKVAPNFL
jgi:hypothetical protein